ncbi:MAG TPA: ferritin-like domain-containing protein [Tepidisphaeraceae bacterium]|jgi:hypothetical protein
MEDAKRLTESHAADQAIVSRRGLLGKAALTGLAAVPVIGMLTSESRAVTQSDLTAADREAFTDIRLHENDHVAFLRKALGSAARPKPSFKGLNTTSFSQFVELSRVFENVGVGAYLGALPSLSSKANIAAAGSIALIEARHAGFLNVFAGRDVSTQAKNNKAAGFDVPLTIQEVVNAASPFIASLNGGPPASFTPGNDVSILNFALLLEHLEADFYNINIPKYFGNAV